MRVSNSSWCGDPFCALAWGAITRGMHRQSQEKAIGSQGGEMRSCIAGRDPVVRSVGWREFLMHWIVALQSTAGYDEAIEK
jgi:hypothetical protein